MLYLGPMSSTRVATPVTFPRGAEAIVTLFAMAAPIWCPLATYFGADAEGRVLAGVLGFVVGAALAVTAYVFGIAKRAR